MMPLLNHNPPEGNCKHMVLVVGVEQEVFWVEIQAGAKNRQAEWEKVHGGMDWISLYQKQSWPGPARLSVRLTSSGTADDNVITRPLSTRGPASQTGPVQDSDEGSR